MKKVELLCPAGNKSMLESAIKNGADAVYLSGKMYGARKFANNFTNSELVDAINYAHIYGVKVYVTINTIIYEQEVDEFIEYVKFLYQNNVDAVLMQDLGMINLVRNIFPNLDVHASTQMHNHNNEGIKYLQDIGVKRIVIARELSLEEIKKIDVPIEKEIFVYGALCISYSGQCLMSSCLLNRSGNRGECAGMCRLPYKLYEEDKLIETDGEYLLSPKELNVLPNLREIINSGVDSLKIEGRMKSPEYVGYVTRIFRRLIDNYYNNEEMNVSAEEITNLKKLFNRDFTLGHLFNQKNHKLMNIKSPNHQGTHLGRASIKKNKVKLELDDDLSQGDGIRFYPDKGMIVNYLYDEHLLLTKKVTKGNVAYVDNKVELKSNCEVLKTLDIELMEKINDIPARKVEVNIHVQARIGKPLKATITDDLHNVALELGMVEKSINSPVRLAEIVDRFSKLNDTPFRLNDMSIDSDRDIFIPVKVMNGLRRLLVERLIQERIKPTKNAIINEYLPTKIQVEKTNTISFLTRTEEQLNYLLDKDVNIYITDSLLYKKYKGKKVYYVSDRVSNHLCDFKNENILASNLSSVVKYGGNNKIDSDIYLNATNSYTLKVLYDMGVEKVGISVESSIENTKLMIDNFYNRYHAYPNINMLIYGRVELMVMKYCPLNMFVNNEQKCNVCQSKKQYYLKDRNSKKLPLLSKNCSTYILNCDNINLLDQIDKLKEIGVNNFTINLFDESSKEIDIILKELK